VCAHRALLYDNVDGRVGCYWFACVRSYLILSHVLPPTAALLFCTATHNGWLVATLV